MKKLGHYSKFQVLLFMTHSVFLREIVPPKLLDKKGLII
jgi:hypothetical protein